ncbi:MAG: PAS domain S-box protein [Verrucomicrobiales bacterium]|nr:PAS domain S-box protein [Verrucomicrobiales bacterium]
MAVESKKRGRAQVADEAGGPSDRENLRVLLVEDVSSDAELIKRELRKSGIAFTARCIDTKEEFLHEIEAFKPHVILSDFSLGQFNAFEALEMLEQSGLDLPFILVTGSQSEEVAVAAIKKGADDYILKASLKRLPSAVLGALKKNKAERERARAESALRWSEEHFRSLIENSSDIITIIDRHGLVSYESPSLERVLGYMPEELLGKSAFDLVHPDDIAMVTRAFNRRTASTGNSKPLEYRVRHKDGSWRVLETVSKDMLDHSGVAGIVVNSRDITERKKAEEQIREQAALLDKAQDAILVHDLEQRIRLWNKSAERLYGWTAEEVLGRKVDELLDEKDSTAFTQARSIAIEKGEWSGELDQMTKNGRPITVESRWSVVSNRKNEAGAMLVINTDITEKKALEAQLLRAQRMESIGTLAGGIAHDLNNVLTPVLLAIKLLRDETSNKTAHELLNTLESSALRGASIVQQVLSFARGVQGERSVFQIKHPLSEIVGIVKDTFPRSIQIGTRILKDLWPVFGDPTQLHQVFMNLCVNARDAMPQGGKLQIEAANVMIDENYARMQPEAKAGPYVVITIADSGVGMPPAIVSKIFEPFFTTKEVGKGTGLGLSTVLGIVRSHGGFVNVYSEVGKGTRFKVHLPAAEWNEKPLLRGEDRIDLPRGQGELIIVADDEEPIREVIKLTLQANDYKVLTANEGTEALARVAEHRSAIRAMLVDVMMPYMDGPATIRAAQRLNPEIRFIVMSGLMENDKVAEIPESAQTAFLAKPFTTEQLLMTLRSLLDVLPAV